MMCHAFELVQKIARIWPGADEQNNRNYRTLQILPQILAGCRPIPSTIFVTSIQPSSRPAPYCDDTTTLNGSSVVKIYPLEPGHQFGYLFILHTRRIREFTSTNFVVLRHLSTTHTQLSVISVYTKEKSISISLSTDHKLSAPLLKNSNSKASHVQR